MNKRECIKAIKKAYRIFGSIAIVKQSPRSIQLSKVKARELIQFVAEDEEINAIWLDEDQQFLIIG